MKPSVAVILGLLLALVAVTHQRAVGQEPEELESAKLELKGYLREETNEGFVGVGKGNPYMSIGGNKYVLDFSKSKELQGKGWLKYKGTRIEVKGVFSLVARGSLTRVVVTEFKILQ